MRLYIRNPFFLCAGKNDYFCKCKVAKPAFIEAVNWKFADESRLFAVRFGANKKAADR